MLTKVARRHSATGGIALIVVLIVILVLAVLAGGFAYSMKVEMRLARNANNEAQLEWLGRSGVELARYVIHQQARIPNEGGYEGLNQKWAGGIGTSNSVLSDIQMENVELGAGTFSVKIVDLERKFNINRAEDTILQRALKLIGVDQSAASTIVDSVADWIDNNGESHRLSGAESDYYLGLDPPYYAKNGLIDDLSELLSIQGITPDIYWGSSSSNHLVSKFQPRMTKRFEIQEPQSYPFGLVDIFTPLSSGKININTASTLVLQMIPGVEDEGVAAEIINFRNGVDGIEGGNPFRSVQALAAVPALSRLAQNSGVLNQMALFCDVRSHTFEVQVDVKIDEYKRQFIAVLRRSNNADLQVIKFYWK